MDGKLNFSMTQENERWNGKNGVFFCFMTSAEHLLTMGEISLFWD